MKLRALKEVWWEMHKYPDQALRIMLEPLVPSYRTERKYLSELEYWRKEISQVEAWFEGRSVHWGLPPPTDAQKEHGSDLWLTNAIMTRHHIYPHLFEELLLEEGALRGKRVLEVGCGPSPPILQFPDCTRHGIDPLIDRYVKAGWPVFDLDVKVINGFAEDMPYPAGYFDAAISRNALDHVDDFGRAAAEIIRVLKPGGQLRFVVEYHVPTLNEPQQLSDASVAAAFAGLAMTKLSERGRDELNHALAKRYNLLLPRLLQAAGRDHGERYAVWDGRKPV